MKTQIDPTTSASRLTRQVLLNIKAARDGDVIANLSNVELLLILNASGNALHRDEIYAVTRDFLLDRAPALCRASDRPMVGSADYGEMIDRFLEDLLHYVESEELQIAIAEGISEERYAAMRVEFARRLNTTAELGLHAVSTQPQTAPPSAAGHIASALPRVAGLCARAIALAFYSWVAVEAPAQTGSNNRRVGTAQQSGPAVKPASARVSPLMQKQFRSLDASDPQERAVALDWFASHGSAVPDGIRAKLRARLTLKDALLRWEAVWLIGTISSGAPEDVQVLTTALHDQDARIQSVAALGLGRIGAAAASALPALRRQNGGSAEVAIDCIARRTPQACREAGGLLEQRGPLLQLMMEQQLQQERAPMGMCMCSFLAAAS